MNKIYTTPFLTNWPTLLSLRQIISWIKGENKNKKKGRRSEESFYKTTTIIRDFGY